jgi:hypothetical protein
MLPDNFDFAMLPEGESKLTLKEVGMLASNIETIDMAMASWVKEDINISTRTNEGYDKVPVLWQVPERSFQIKNRKQLRDDAGALKLPLISIERTGIAKDPNRKGSFQANYYSDKKNGRPGRWVIARRVIPSKTNAFATNAISQTATETDGTLQQYSPRANKKIVVQIVSIPIPVYINVTYKISLKSEYQQQMNDMLAPFIGRTGQINGFVMRRNGHLYEGFIEQDFTHSNNVNNLAEDMRMFTSEITIRVIGYLIGEGDNSDRPIVRIDENIVEFTYPTESPVPMPGTPNIFGGAFDVLPE